MLYLMPGFNRGRACTTLVTLPQRGAMFESESSKKRTHQGQMTRAFGNRNATLPWRQAGNNGIRAGRNKVVDVYPDGRHSA